MKALKFKLPGQSNQKVFQKNSKSLNAGAAVRSSDEIKVIVFPYSSASNFSSLFDLLDKDLFHWVNFHLLNETSPYSMKQVPI